MRRSRRRAQWVGRIFGTLAVSSLLWVLARQVPELLARMETFAVDEIEVSGTRYLSGTEAARLAGVPAGSSVWDETADWEERLTTHPLVQQVRIKRRPPGTLVFEITENSPVALVASPELEPVGADGRVLPLDLGQHRLDLPLLRVSRDPANENFSSAAGVRSLLEELERLENVDPEFRARISEAWLTDRGDIGIRLVAPDVAFYWRPPVSARRLEEGMASLTRAFSRDDGRVPDEVDLRFAEQVVVRFQERLR